MGLRLCCVAISLLIAAGCKEGSHTRTQATEAPRVLADGGGPARLPSALRRFHGKPVLGARELPARFALRSCPIDRELRVNARFSQAWVSTEGLTVELVSPSVLVACDAVKERNRWVPCGLRATLSRDPRRVELSGGGLNVLCQRPTRIEAMWIVVPRAATWAFVDHGNFWVAYRSPRRPLIRVTNRGSSGRFRVAFLDQRSRLLRERRIRGYVAG